ncbi:hypothetical protein CEP53_004404 [Fusarium sp. AF-6]|nr:hypothetical protein CEP53_004404 [Fusarium sp. AF-6]
MIDTPAPSDRSFQSTAQIIEQDRNLSSTLPCRNSPMHHQWLPGSAAYQTVVPPRVQVPRHYSGLCSLLTAYITAWQLKLNPPRVLNLDLDFEQ